MRGKAPSGLGELVPQAASSSTGSSSIRLDGLEFCIALGDGFFNCLCIYLLLFPVFGLPREGGSIPLGLHGRPARYIAAPVTNAH